MFETLSVNLYTGAAAVRNKFKKYNLIIIDNQPLTATKVSEDLVYL